MGLSAGADTIVYTVSNTCGATAARLPVTINATPLAGAITGRDSLCVGNEVTLAESVGGGVWSVSNTNVAIDSTGMTWGMTEGMDTVIYTVSNGWCSAYTTAVITVFGSGDCPALGETSPRPSAKERVLYPNPVTAELHIDNAAGCEVRIFDLVGQSFGKIRMATDKESIDFRGLSDGIYIVQIIGGDGVVQNYRVVKE